MKNRRSFGVIFKRDLINLILNPALFVYNSVFAPLLIVVLGYLKGNGYDYFGVAILIYASLNVSTTAANSFMERNIKATNLRVMYAPIPLESIYLGKIFASFVFTSVFTVLHILLLQSLGVNFGGILAFYVALLLLSFNLFSSALGVFFCCVFKNEETTNLILSTVNNILALIGGLFFSWDSFGKVFEKISFLSPVKWVSEAAFRIIYDNDFKLFGGLVISFGIFVLLLILGCKITFKTEDYL